MKLIDMDFTIPLEYVPSGLIQQTMIKEDFVNKFYSEYYNKFYAILRHQSKDF